MCTIIRGSAPQEAKEPGKEQTSGTTTLEIFDHQTKEE
jgi:hypothetical protein